MFDQTADILDPAFPFTDVEMHIFQHAQLRNVVANGNRTGIAAFDFEIDVLHAGGVTGITRIGNRVGAGWFMAEFQQVFFLPFAEARRVLAQEENRTLFAVAN